MTRRVALWGLMIIAVLALIPLLALVGHPVFSPKLLWSTQHASLDSAIYWQIRLPRAMTAFVAGAMLAMCGMTFQALFRTPLATPFTLGTSSGAALGAVLSIQTGFLAFLPGFPAVSMSAFLGALMVTFAIYGLSRLRTQASPATLLLCGVAASYITSSLMLVVQYASDLLQSFRMMHWLMGGIERSDPWTLGFLALVMFLGWLVLFIEAPALNLLALGDELALARGVDVSSTRTRLFFLCSLMVGSVVAICGPIGFVGMMVPHVGRMILGPDHRSLLWVSVLGGGLFLGLCDMLARTLLAPVEIPVGIITALLGGPFFLWLLVIRDPQGRPSSVL